ncbi:LysE/ArgO family amino acid transporter [Pseudoduganella namucuonensis]|uniref:L-lysine exporter family protein LysE/ArgO n=1 Tax=Pseudoduganella namucuonensis TaxID=1035707 RepID=A0A1I7JQG7_9BURK|nr:LysE/ArgO family amino acid transporter [Pseudoduganella namucuonensis]SFU87400.1 L-lysine exporter family protein LysE/ArgO [Pseudoduganella namucuonensis]
MFTPQVFLSGLGLGASLIMAIGAQNAHVLRVGVRRQHVALTVATCVVIDVLLIGAGVAGMGVLIQSSPLLMGAARWGGAAFLLWYGLRSWAALLRPGALPAGEGGAPVSARNALLSVLAMSLLNPHVYLDAVVLLGAIGGNYPAHERPSFAVGAMTASLIWFTALGFGASRLSDLLRRPLAWKCIEALTGAIMLALAAALAFGG